MLSVQKLRNVLQKLQASDLAKFFIQRATAAASGGADGNASATGTKTLVNQENHKSFHRLHTQSKHIMPSQVDSSSPKKSSVADVDDGNEIKPKTITSKLSTVSLFSNSERVGNCSEQEIAANLLKLAKLTTSSSTLREQSNKTNKKMSDSADATHEKSVSCGDNGSTEAGAAGPSGTGKEKACFNSSLADIVQFLELVGSLKHTKRTGWVLRDVPDCESISGHMYRMSLMTFLLDGTEGLNQIRCMELALVHDLAESLVGDITPFCGVSKEDKKALELKAMADICKLIEPRGRRIMQLFEEYENAESAESKFVKDLDRLDMVLQAFEYEKRDDCVMKHQEFFDSTHGKFNHPFVIKLVNEIHDQRKALAVEKGVQSGDQSGQNGFHEEPSGDSLPTQDQKASSS